MMHDARALFVSVALSVLVISVGQQLSCLTLAWRWRCRAEVLATVLLRYRCVVCLGLRLWCSYYGLCGEVLGALCSICWIDY